MHTEETPNPLSLKFYPDTPLLEGEVCVFSSASSVRGAPFLEDLLSLPGVHSLMLAPEFMTVTKVPEIPWSLLESIIFSILQHYQNTFPLSTQALQNSAVLPVQSEEDVSLEEIPLSGSGQLHTKRFLNWTPPSEEIQAICVEIEELLETHIQPAVRADGGQITFLAFEEGTVYVQMQGACSGCPHSQVTLQEGIQRTLRYYVPEVHTVQAVEGE